MVIFSIAEILTGGSKKTVEPAREHGRPVLHLSKVCGASAAEAALRRFIAEHGIRVLNVAGPRASREPEGGGVCESNARSPVGASR
jgi:hypothetical protein